MTERLVSAVMGSLLLNEHVTVFCDDHQTAS